MDHVMNVPLDKTFIRVFIYFVKFWVNFYWAII